jgi:hypothetical protein
VMTNGRSNRGAQQNSAVTESRHFHRIQPCDVGDELCVGDTATATQFVRHSSARTLCFCERRCHTSARRACAFIRA